jgi:phosphoglycolate phosphatase
MIKHVLFDFDGTLIDSAPYVLTAYREAFKSFDITPKVEINEAIIGPPLVNTVQMLLGDDHHPLVQPLVDKFMALYDGGVAENTFFYDGVADLINNLKSQGCRLYIATNKRYKPTVAILEHLGFFGTFTDVRAVDQLPTDKRSKATLIKEICEDYAITLNEAIYVGDKLDDFKAADANNMTFLAAGWGYGEWKAPFKIALSPIDLFNHFKT